MSETILRKPAHEPTRFHGMVTVAPEMETFFEQVRRVARTDSTVLIRGETGTGKELVARLLHDLSGRRKAPFKALNCATLTSELLASELFGHVRGSFTGAIRDRKGLFAQAHGGTIFLDEIAEMPLDIQARLLRVLQERTFVPVGGTERVSVNVRVLSATHRSLRERVEAKTFREDLMYRVRVVPIFLPRLAERQGDIEALTWVFIERFNALGYRHVEGVSSDAMRALLAYQWPGNVRELLNVIEYTFALGQGPVLTLDELTPELRNEPPPAQRARPQTLEDIERERIMSALRQCKGRRSDAAEQLGMSRSTLWRKLKMYGLSS